jgi:hypothetical protein
MLSSGEKLLMEIIMTKPPQQGPQPYNENDPAVLASRSQHTVNVIKALLEPLKKRRRANAEKAAAAAAEHAALQKKMAALVGFINGLQMTFDQAKGLLGDCVEFLQAITAQMREADAICEAVFAQSDDIVGAVYTAHKRHYEVQELLDSIVEQTRNASLPWLQEFNDAKQALPLKMVIQARMAASIGWQKATNVQWPVVVATYELLVPLAERLKGELVAALAEDELWLAPLKKTAAALDVQRVVNSRGARLAFANKAEVQVFMKEEIIDGETSKCKTYQVYLADDKKADNKTNPHSVVKNRVASLESMEKRNSMSTQAPRKISMSLPSPRRFSIGGLSARRTSVSTPPPRSVSVEQAPAPEAPVSKSPGKKGFLSRLPVWKDSTSVSSTRRGSLHQSPALKGFVSRLPVRKDSVSKPPAPKVGCP